MDLLSCHAFDVGNKPASESRIGQLRQHRGHPRCVSVKFIMNRAPEALVAALLTNRLVTSETKALTAREFWNLFSSSEKLHGLIDMDSSQIAQHLSVDLEFSDRIVALLATSRAFAFEVERLEETDLRIVTAFDDDFPEKLRRSLGSQCPVVLLTTGLSEWLSLPSIGIVGSRAIGLESMEVARNIAQLAVQLGYGVVSGLAKGIDQTSMHSATEIEGRVIGFPTEGLHVVSQRSDVRMAIHDGRLTLASPFNPKAPFSVGGAMARNKLIYGLADATIVVTSDKDKGGTWGGATEAIDKSYGHVIVWNGPGMGGGNLPLIQRGATGLEGLSPDLLTSALQKSADVKSRAYTFEALRLF